MLKKQSTLDIFRTSEPSEIRKERMKAMIRSILLILILMASTFLSVIGVNNSLMKDNPALCDSTYAYLTETVCEVNCCNFRDAVNGRTLPSSVNFARRLNPTCEGYTDHLFIQNIENSHAQYDYVLALHIDNLSILDKPQSQYYIYALHRMRI